jgi:hypothetical protein
MVAFLVVSNCLQLNAITDLWLTDAELTTYIYGTCQNQDAKKSEGKRWTDHCLQLHENVLPDPNKMMVGAGSAETFPAVDSFPNGFLLLLHHCWKLNVVNEQTFVQALAYVFGVIPPRKSGMSFVTRAQGQSRDSQTGAGSPAAGRLVILLCSNQILTST